MSNVNEMIDAYGEQKKIFDPMKKDMEKQGTLIKSLMQDSNTDYIQTEKFKATLTERVSEGFNEDKLINALNSMTYKDETTGTANICVGTGLNIVKMKPYVDMDALEEAIYKGLISDENLLKIGECKTVKKTYALTVKSLKKENE